MPRKENMPQIDLKLSVPEYTLLQAEATRADVPVNTYARQLVLTRGHQPVAATAAAVQAHYQLREEAHALLLTEYADAAFQTRVLSQQLVQVLSLQGRAGWASAEAAAQALAQPPCRSFCWD